MSLDPYRTLGLEPGASSAEVKRAYRRLAKAFHPDSAGEAALPRFLAIHEAYDAIKTGRAPRASRGGAGPAAPSPAPTAEPWRADPARARAARERARTARGARTPGAGRSSQPGGGTRPRPPGAAASSGTSGTRGGRRGGTRKATLGSTSYDEARDPADATWSGASWYGPTTGEYWIINPREYADPRKHGPEYQSRARRMAADASASGTIQDEPLDEEPLDDESPFAAMPEAGADPGVEGAAAETAAGPEARHAGARPEAFEMRAAAADPRRGRTRAERAARAAHAARAPRPVREARSPGETGAGTFPNMGGSAASPDRRPIRESARDWLAPGPDDPVRRIGSALVAWPPIGLAAAAAIGEVTGCSAYSVECAGTDSLLPWLAQAGIVGLLLLLPAFARLLAGGTVAVLLALVPVTGFLVVLGGAGEPEAGFALAFLLGIAWILGVAGSIVAARRRVAPDGAGVQP